MQKIILLPERYLIDFEDGSLMELSEKTLIKFIKDEDLNLVYDDPEELVRVCPKRYLAEHYENIINLWIVKQELCNIQTI